VLAGHDPASVRFRLVVDMTWALLVEIYRDYEMKFEAAVSEITKAISPESPQAEKAVAVDEAASMTLLQAMMAGSDFKGPKG